MSIPKGRTALPWHLLQLLNTSTGSQIYSVFTASSITQMGVVMKRMCASKRSKKKKPDPLKCKAASWLKHVSCRATGAGRCLKHFITGNSPIPISSVYTACSSRLETSRERMYPSTLTTLFLLRNRSTNVWRNGWLISIQWQLPHMLGSKLTRATYG